MANRVDRAAAPPISCDAPFIRVWCDARMLKSGDLSVDMAECCPLNDNICVERIKQRRPIGVSAKMTVEAGLTYTEPEETVLTRGAVRVE